MYIFGTVDGDFLACQYMAYHMDEAMAWAQGLGQLWLLAA